MNGEVHNVTSNAKEVTFKLLEMNKIVSNKVYAGALFASWTINTEKVFVYIFWVLQYGIPKDLK